jgi:hypothetical protein
MSSDFGFEVPQGDPGALEAAAGSWRQLGTALDLQGQAVAAGGQVALVAGAWEGSAANSFAGSAERLVDAHAANVGACAGAAAALSELSRALEQAQQTTRQALADCEQYSGQVTTQQTAADQAGTAAQHARDAAAAAVHPSAAAALNREAGMQEQQQATAQHAATQAQNQLNAARTRGQQAVTAYEGDARAVVGRLHGAAGELRPVPELGHGWADPVVTWAGHANDFAGAAAVGLVKGYDKAIGLATDKLEHEITDTLGDSAARQSIMAGEPLAGFDDNAPDPLFGQLEQLRDMSQSPFSTFVQQGIPEGWLPDTAKTLSEVPFLAWAFTGLDMYMNRNNGLGSEVVEPLGNLALGTGITDAVAPAVASGVATLTGEGGMLAALGTTAVIPGVGEAVITGVVVVGSVVAIDYGVTQAWDHRAAIVHGLDDAWHGVEDAGTWVWNNSLPGELVNHGGTIVHDAGHVIHDLEPWHWSL